MRLDEWGWVLYPLLAVLLYAFWRRMRGRTLDDLLARSAHEHHRVLRILARHPYGGSWRQFRRWMEEEEAKRDRRPH